MDANWKADVPTGPYDHSFPGRLTPSIQFKTTLRGSALPKLTADGRMNRCPSAVTSNVPSGLSIPGANSLRGLWDRESGGERVSGLEVRGREISGRRVVGGEGRGGGLVGVAVIAVGEAGAGGQDRDRVFLLPEDGPSRLFEFRVGGL